MIGIIYGAKTDDMDEAKDWIVAATGLMACGREGYQNGGEYYTFERADFDGRFKIINNVDCDDIDYEYEQIAYVEYKEWPLLVFLDVDNKKNEVIWTMVALTDKFTRLAAEAYDENGEYYAEDDIDV